MDKRDYLARVNLVLDYIQAHLADDLQLQTLAEIASFSPYHFHRIFKALVGENLNTYIRRLRLERAAYLLSYNPAMSVTEVAGESGFASNATFTRAFTQYFGISPSQFRQIDNQHMEAALRKIGKVNRNDSKAVAPRTVYDEQHPVATELMQRELIHMKVEVKQLPDYHVAYVRHFGGFEKGVYSKDLSNAFEKCGTWMAARDLLTPDTECIGITYDHFDLTDHEKCRYDAAFTIPANIVQPDGEIGIQDIPGGKYACCPIEVENTSESSFAEAIAGLGHAVDYLFGEWLPNSGYVPADRPCLELYLTPMNAPIIRITLCLPIQPA